MDQSYEVRRVRVEEAELYSTFSRQLFVDTFGPANTEEDLAIYLPKTFAPARQEADLRDPTITVFVITAEGRGFDWAGYAQVRDRVAVEPAVVATRPLEIQRFYVDRPFHGTGVARELMRVIEHFAVQCGCDVLWLGVWEFNPRAIAFYQKCGFTTVGRTVFELGNDRQHDFVMSKALEAERV